MYINTAEEIAGIPSSWPGYNLDIATWAKISDRYVRLSGIAELNP